MRGAAGLRIALTEDADADLVGITIFTLDNFGRRQADRYSDGLARFISELPAHPHRLKRVETRAGAYFRAVYQSHVLFVRKEANRLLVVRILHDRMDPNNYLP